MKTVEKSRVEWIDIFKLLGIIAIFCGHLGRNTGGLHDFVFLYHVPLFFFASGIFAYRMEESDIWQVIKKKWKQIIMPYLFFAAISMVVIILTTNEDCRTYLGYAKQFVFGIRNQMYASSLWFLPCLFCMSILFYMIRRIFRKRIFILIASIALWLIASFVFPNRPDVTPSWIFNIDSACYYLIYYTAGYLLHEKLTEDCQEVSKRKKVFVLIGSAILTGYVLLVYVQQDFISTILCRNIIGMQYVYPVLRTFLLILFNIILAKLMVNVGNMHKPGEQTLWMCGNEFIVKKIFDAIAGIAGFQININSALAAVLYAVVMVLFIYYVLMPFEQKIYQRLLEIIGLGKSQ